MEYEFQSFDDFLNRRRLLEFLINDNQKLLKDEYSRIYSHIFKNDGVDDYFCFGEEINPSINERNTILDYRERLILKDFIKKRREILDRIKSYKKTLKELDNYISSITKLTIYETSILFRDYFINKTNKNYNIYYSDLTLLNHSMPINIPRAVICEENIDITKTNIIGKDYIVLVGNNIDLFNMYLYEEDQTRKEIISTIIDNQIKKGKENVKRIK